MFTGKVFGIGFQKTATTSLQQALNMLGFRGVTWPHQMWPAIVAGQEKFKILEHVQSLTDFPIPYIYRRLDKAYPDSKFILTVRDSDSWLKSAENHFKIMEAPLKRLGNVSWHDQMRAEGIPVDEIHIAIYGRPDFEAEAFLSAYERHNEEVQTHFKDRPDDLLVMEMGAGDEWAQLCPFLGVSVPNAAYPKAHKTSECEPGEDLSGVRS
ncbi:MAG: sulfotransferase family protein [Pseudomonadota bacterium]